MGKCVIVLWGLSWVLNSERLSMTLLFLATKTYSSTCRNDWTQDSYWNCPSDRRKKWYMWKITAFLPEMLLYCLLQSPWATQTVSPNCFLVTVIPICTWQECCLGVINSEIGVKHTLPQLLTAAEGAHKCVGLGCKILLFYFNWILLFQGVNHRLRGSLTAIKTRAPQLGGNEFFVA